jgi:hypothetical protein
VNDVRVRDVCTGCGRQGPEARSTKTLTEQGWRIDFGRGDDGKPQVAWLCPKCFEHKTGSTPLLAKKRT